MARQLKPRNLRGPALTSKRRRRFSEAEALRQVPCPRRVQHKGLRLHRDFAKLRRALGKKKRGDVRFQHCDWEKTWAAQSFMVFQMDCNLALSILDE